MCIATPDDQRTDPDHGFRTLRRYEQWKADREHETFIAFAEMQADVDRKEAEFHAKRLAPKPGQLSRPSEDRPGVTLLLFRFFRNGGENFVWAENEDVCRRMIDDRYCFVPSLFTGRELPVHGAVKWSQN